MMNQVEKIVIERRGALVARINMLDANDRVINTIKTTEMLAYDDYTIDRETIAELCGMTVDTLNRFYYLDSTGYCKVIDYGVVLTEAEFTKKNCFDILLDAIQNGDIKIADDEPDDFDFEYELAETNYEDDYEDRIAELRRTEGFQECFEDFRTFLSERTIGSKPKEEPVIIEIEEPVVSESKVVEIQSNKSPVVAKLEELMVQALEEGDFAKYDELEERLNRISK